MQVVALISGGKDSLFSILHCIANGHEVVALANLYPNDLASDEHSHTSAESRSIEDVDSHMYQTVGHRVISLYEEALGIPLFRQPITGDAFQKDQVYDHSVTNNVKQTSIKDEWDETESLTSLLTRVKALHPGVNAVSTGAILSTYQRTRIESVALRLGLVPLSFLWQYPYLPPVGHSTLLDDMAQVGADAHIIKVASGGLDASHLWLNVADPKTVAKLERDLGRFGELEVGSVLGEGGDYETLAIDGPAPLWKKRIAIDVDDDCIIRDAGDVAHVSIQQARLESKTPAQTTHVRIPDLLEESWQAILQQLQSTVVPTFASESEPVLETPTEAPCLAQEHTFSTSKHIHLVNVTAEPGLAIGEQARGVTASVVASLSSFGLCAADITSVTILLHSMQDFAVVNATYKQLFSRPLPPARVTVACGNLMPPGISLMLSATVNRSNHNARQGLHVQSQSYWAPANIGPYSQAISVPLPSTEDEGNPSRVVYIAGQIPFVPASMELVEGPFELHAILALQHLWRIGRAMNVGWWVNGLAFITAMSDEEAASRAACALEAWRKAVEQPLDESEERDEDFDIGNLHLRQPWQQHAPRSSMLRLSSIPDWSRVDMTRFEKVAAPPCFVAQVEELPRAACVEWTSIGLALGAGANKVASLSSGIGRHHTVDGASGTYWTMLTAQHQQEVGNVFRYMDKELEHGEVDLLEAYVKIPTGAATLQWLQRYRAQVTPCRRLWSENGSIVLLLRCRWIQPWRTRT